MVDIRDIRRLLHLKTGISWLGGRRLLVSDDIAGNEALRGWDLVRVPPGEDYAANCVAVNGAVLVPEGFPKTAAMLRRDWNRCGSAGDVGVQEDGWGVELFVGEVGGGGKAVGR